MNYIFDKTKTEDCYKINSTVMCYFFKICFVYKMRIVFAIWK